MHNQQSKVGSHSWFALLPVDSFHLRLRRVFFFLLTVVRSCLYIYLILPGKNIDYKSNEAD